MLLLLGFFTSLLIIKFADGSQVSCGCFGTFSKGAVDLTSIMRNGILVVTILLIMAGHSERESMHALQEDRGPSEHQATRRVFNSGFAQHIGSIFSLMPLLALSLLLGVSAVLAMQNRVLNERLQILLSSTTLHAGDAVRNFFAVGLSGKEEAIPCETDSITLLLVFKTTCKPCVATLPIWIQLAHDLSRRDVKVRAVSLDSIGVTQRFVSGMDLPFEVLCVNGDGFRSRMKIVATPQTILVKRGVVNSIWTGALTSELSHSVKEAAVE